MSELITQAISSLESFPVMLLTKATLILAGGAVIALLMSRASASARHATWALTLASTLALPLGMLVLPAWKMIAAERAIESAAVTESSVPRAPVSTVRAAGQEVTTAMASPPSTIPLVPLLLLIWGAGTVVLIIRMIAGRITILRITRRAEAPDTRVIGELRGEMARLDIRKDVELVYSRDVVSPMASGIFSPVILLPESARSWSDEHRQVVVRHELAHIASGDAIICLIAGLTCAAYWFHPLVWIASRRMRAEQERACDDRVLSLGTPAPEYAAHLLEVARTARAIGIDGFISMAMARPSQLEGRLLAVLSGQRRRGMVSRRVAASAAAATLIGVSAVSMIQPVSTEAAIVVASQGFSAPAELDPVVAIAKKTGVPSFDSTVTAEVPVPSGGTLELDLKTGASITINTWNESRVRMTAMLRGRGWRHTRVALVPQSAGARISTSYRSTGPEESSHTMQITIPRHFNVRLNSAGGSVALRNFDGEITGSTGGGDIQIDESRGRAELRTGGGLIHVTRSHMSGKVSTGAGAVMIEDNSGGLEAYSGAGGVIRSAVVGEYAATEGGGFVRRSDGRVVVQKPGGGVSISNAAGGASISTGGGSVSIGRAGGSVNVTTGGGAVTVGPVKGTATASTGAGDVVITVDGDDTKDVDVSSGNGRVTLIVPRNLSATLDLETAYTNNRRSSTRIISEWPLDVDETADWDSSRGTPRRYVRVRQQVGGGRRTIRVRTVNGDIVFRYK